MNNSPEGTEMTDQNDIVTAPFDRCVLCGERPKAFPDSWDTDHLCPACDAAVERNALEIAALVRIV